MFIYGTYKKLSVSNVTFLFSQSLPTDWTMSVIPHVLCKSSPEELPQDICILFYVNNKPLDMDRTMDNSLLCSLSLCLAGIQIQISKHKTVWLLTYGIKLLMKSCQKCFNGFSTWIACICLKDTNCFLWADVKFPLKSLFTIFFYDFHLMF